MASITIQFPDAIAPRVLDAFAAQGWTVDTGMTKAQWAKAKVVEYIRLVTIAYEESAANLAAHNAAQVQIEASKSEIVIS